MKKRVLVLAPNPKKGSFTFNLAEAYARSAEKEHEVQLLDLSDMEFNLDLSGGYAMQHTMEESLKLFQDSLAWCDHFVVFTPVWWGSLPAKFKGLIDRTFLPDFAFKYENGSLIPKKLLQEKTARIVMTMDTPPWYFFVVEAAPALRQLKDATLKLVGFGKVKSKMTGPIINSTKESRVEWLKYVSNLGCSAS